MLALPIFPASHPASIVGEGVLNFCVRDGNRWTHTPINTNFSGYTLKTEHGHFISASYFCNKDLVNTLSLLLDQAFGLLVSVS